MRLKSFTHLEKTLAQLVDEADAGRLAIPIFQRSYVWKSAQVEALGDSIVRGYPIGSMLVMGNGGTLKVANRALHSSSISVHPQALNLMDGQQRATSLHRLFGDREGKERFYFDMLAILTNDFPFDRLESLFAAKFLVKKSVDTDAVCVRFPYAIEEKPLNNGGRYISCQQVLSNKTFLPMQKFMNGLAEVGIDKDKLAIYHDHLNGIFSAVASYQISLVQIDANAPLDLICRVFEKVNSSGTDLTLVDLLNAKSYNARSGFEGGAVSYVENQIKSSNLFRGNAQNWVKKFFKFDPASASFKNLMPIFKMIAVAEKVQNGDLEPRVTNAEIMALEPHEWFTLWDRYDERVLNFIGWSNDVGILSYSADNVLELFGGISIGIPEAFKIPEFRDAAIRYMFSLAVGGGIFSHSDYPKGHSFIPYAQELLALGPIHRSSVAEPTPIQPVDVEQIHSAGSKTKSCRAILSLMYRRNYLGKFSTDLFGNSVKVDDPQFDIHHLVPKSEWGTEKNHLFDTVANLVYLDVDANRHKLSDKKLKEAINTIKSRHGDDPRRFGPIFDSSLVPTAALDRHAFVLDRAQQILSYVNSYLHEKRT